MKQCITCLSENISKIVEDNRIYYFCDNCKKKNARYIDNEGKIKTEISDGKIKHFDVAALIKKNNKYLFINRKDFPYGISLPVGHLKYGENATDGLERKIFEETGLRIKKAKLILNETFTDYCKYGGEIHEWLLYECEITGNPQMSFDTLDLSWVEKDKIKYLNLIPSIKFVLARIGLLPKKSLGEARSELLSYSNHNIRTMTTESMIENMPMAMAIFNKEGEVLEINKSARKLLENMEKENQNGYNAILDLTKNTVYRVIQNKKDMSSNIKLGDRSFNLVANLFSQKGKIAGVVITAKDISKIEEKETISSLAYQTSLSLTTSTNSTKIITNIVNQLIFNLELSSVSLMLKEGNLLKTVLWLGNKGKRIKRKPLELKIGQGVAGMVAKTGISLASNDIENDLSFKGSLPPKTEQSILSVPVVLNKSVIGVLNVTRPKNSFFTDVETKTILAIGNKIGIAVETGKLYKDLSDEKNLLAEILQSTTNGIILIDRDLKIKYINQAARSMQYIDENAKTIKEIMAPLNNKDSSKFWNLIQNAIANKKKASAEFVVSKRSKRYLKEAFKPILNQKGEVTGLLLVINDITELKRKQETINNKNIRISSIMNNTNEGITAFGTRKQVLFSNNAIQKIVKKVSGCSNVDQFVQLIFPPLDKLRLGRPFHQEIRLKDRDQEDLWINVNYTLVEDRSGKTKSIVAVTHDITQDKLFQTKQKEFTYTITHELRTPITAIKGYISMILNGDAGKISPKQQVYFSRVFNSTTKLINLVEDILQAARVENDKINYNIEKVNSKELISEVVNDFQKKACDKYIDIKTTDSDPIYIKADYDKTRQILSNFVDNAIKYTAKGKVTISAEIQKQQAIIKVKDTGVGIPNKDISMIFEKFYRVPNSQSIKEGGTGLGLFIAKSMAAKQNGNITVRSKIGKGSEFTLALPIYNS